MTGEKQQQDTAEGRHTTRERGMYRSEWVQEVCPQFRKVAVDFVGRINHDAAQMMSSL